MSSTLSPNMDLIIPTVGDEPGPQYAQDVNDSLTRIDQHDHTPGNGVQLTSSSLNINQDFTLNDFSLTDAASLNITPMLSDAAMNSLYMKGVDLYFRDGSGNAIRVTQAGSVTGSSGTITGLPSGTASASYLGGVFTFQAATATPADIDGGSFILRNPVSGSSGLTLSAPSLGADYTITLPALPASIAAVAIDSNGDMASYLLSNTIQPSGGVLEALTVVDNGISTVKIQDGAVTNPKIGLQAVQAGNIANNTITANQISNSANITGTQIAPLAVTGSNIASHTITVDKGSLMSFNGTGVVGSGQVGYTGAASSTTSSTSFAIVAGQQLTLVTNGRPVRIEFSPAPGVGPAYATGNGIIRLSIDSLAFEFQYLIAPGSSAISPLQLQPICLSSLADVGSGTHTINVQFATAGFGNFSVLNARLMAYEI